MIVVRARTRHVPSGPLFNSKTTNSTFPHLQKPIQPTGPGPQPRRRKGKFQTVPNPPRRAIVNNARSLSTRFPRSPFHRGRLHLSQSPLGPHTYHTTHHPPPRLVRVSLGFWTAPPRSLRPPDRHHACRRARCRTYP